MPLTLTPVPRNLLSPEAARACNPESPAAARMLAARGLLPLGPTDLTTVLYQLTFDPDSKVAEAARARVGELPDTVVSAALAGDMHPMVLDFYARALLHKPLLLQPILLNRRTDDETLIFLASCTEDAESEILAANQQRLLACPAIIESLYFNAKARMSTIQRLLEMAARNGLDLKRVPHFKAMMKSLRGEPVPPVETDSLEDPDLVIDISADAGAAVAELALESAGDMLDSAFQDALGEDWEEDLFDGMAGDDDKLSDEDTSLARLSSLPVNARIRLATLGSSMHRAVLIKDSNRLVSLAAISSPAVSDTEAARYAANRSLTEDVVRYICGKKEWHKNYLVKVALVNNPKCPLAHSMRLVNHLRVTDLRAVSMSKNVPSALAQVAKRLMNLRRGGGK